jgi:hypothetical protein
LRYFELSFQRSALSSCYNKYEVETKYAVTDAVWFYDNRGSQKLLEWSFPLTQNLSRLDFVSENFFLF